MKSCPNCSASFEVFPEDRIFYDRIGVPDPTHCPTCRMQRKLAFRNERTLYRRKCDLTGKEMISCFSPEKRFVVYDNDVWWTDRWSALEYGRTFDVSKPFFEQFLELREKVPRMARQQQQPIENCDYSNAIGHSKNCYLMTSTNHCEDCYYGTWVNDSRNCVDCYSLENCELCYQCVNCRDCYGLSFCENTVNSRNSAFLSECIGCSDCLCSVNLRNKQYVAFNTQLSKEKYLALREEFSLGNFSNIQKLQTQFRDMKQNMIVKEIHGVNLQNCTGDYLRNCKNTFFSFDCDDTEDVRYSIALQNAKTCMDYAHWGMNAELMYECHACGYDVFGLSFCNLCWGGCHDLWYSDHCFNSACSFGCVGLKNEKYCILNTKYPKEEYERLLPEIIEHMKKTGEWGEFFSVKDSLFAYNETVAQEYFSLSRSEVIAKKWQWRDPDVPDFSHVTKKIPAVKLPGEIRNIPDDILNWAIECIETAKPFLIQKGELEFYRQMDLAVPRTHPDVRHEQRLRLRNPRRVWDRNCFNCGKKMITTYAPERPEKVSCESCYFQQVL